MQKFLRTLTLVALLVVPWVMQGQNAKVSEYDYEVATQTYSSIVGTTGATAWTAADQAAGHVDIALPFGLQFGETAVAANSTLRVYPNGSATFETVTGLADSRIAPLYYSAGYTTTPTSIYYKATTGNVVVEWRKVTSGDNSYSFQLKLYSNGDIEFCYGPMTTSTSLYVFTGMQTSETDVFRARGEGGTLYWNTLERATDYATRTLSSTYRPDYTPINANSGTGVAYTFTKPACVKPTSIYASASAWNTINVEWEVSSTGTGYEVKYSTNPDFDPSTEGTSKTVSGGNTLTTTLTNLTGSTTYYIYVRKMCNTTPSGWSQMTSATTLPGCYSANIPSVNSQGEVSWTSPGDVVTSYDLKYGLVGFDPETEGTTVNNIAALTYTLPVASLAAASTYDIYLRAHCSASGLTTDWVGPVSFNTPCAAVTISAANTINEGFEGTVCPPLCWTGIAPSSDNALTFVTDNYYSGEQSFRFSSYNSASEYDQYLISPELNSTDQMQVAFKYARYGTGDNIQVGYSTTTNDTSAFTWMDWMTGGINSWDSYNAMVPANTKYIAIHYYGNFAYYVWVDDLAITPPPTCPNPSALAIDNVTGNNVTLSWTENGTATAWQIAYGLFTNENDYTIVDATTNPFTVSNLGFGEWFFYVRSNCAADDQSEWVGGVSQNFGYCTPAPSSHDNSGITHVTFGMDYVVNDNNTTIASTRYQDHHDMIGDVYAGVSADIFITYATSYTYGTKIWVDLNNDLEFSNDDLLYTGLSTNSNPTTLVASITIPASTPLGDYRLRIGGTDNDSGPSDACYTGSYGVFRDYTVRVVAAPSCFVPSGLTASNVTATTATLTWDEVGLSTQWEVKVGPRGFDPNEEGTSYTVNTTTTLALDYLFMLKEYDAYVRAICDPEGPTEWSNVCEFRTLCPNGGSVTMGTGTTATSGVIVNSSWGNTYCQQIFTAAELAAAGLQAGDIAGMTFTWNGNGSYQKDFSIYLGNTTQENFSSTTAWVPIASQTLVYGPTLRPTTGTAGEQEYTFTTPFTWDGTSNIVVSTFINQHGGSQTGSGFNSYSTNSGMTNMAMWKYRDSQAFTESEVDGLTASSRSGYRASIKFIRPCDTGSCNAPTTVIAISETEYAATLTFTDVNEETNPTYGIVYGPQGFDPTTAGTTVSPITTSAYTISGLNAQTSYDVFVYAICSGTNGRMVKYNFVTPFIPNCKTPIIDGEYGASNITYNTATLTWRQPGDAPMFWTVRYADADFNPATAAATSYTELTVQGAAGATAQLTGLVAGTTYYVYIKTTCATAPDLDESPWLQMSNANPAYTFTTPACVEPTNVVATDVTNSTAMIRWTEAGVATAWTVKYGPKDFDPDNEGIEVASTADSIEITGLAAAESFDVYVKANCTATDESGWSDACTFATVCPGTVPGSDYTAQIGSAGSSSTYGPALYGNYGNSYCQQIYTAEELIAAGMQPGNINSLTFTWTNNSTYAKEFTIYMGLTDQSSFESTTAWVPLSNQTLVYGTAEHSLNTSGEVEYTFNTPFAWDGVSNIVVTDFMNQPAGVNQSTSGFYSVSTTTSPVYRCMYLRKDNNPYTVDQVSATASGRSYLRSDITFKGAVCDPTITCFAPASVSTSITTANVVTVNWAPRTDLRPVVNNYELKYGLTGFDPETQGVLVPSLNNVTTYTIDAELAANTNYDVYVRTVCGENDYSNWTKASFTTYPTCWTPVDLTVDYTTQNSATLSWANNADAPTQATRWEVCYGPKDFGDPEYRGTKVETTNNTEFVVTGLKHSSKYDFYVRALCSATDKSDWSEVATGTTQCGVWAMADLPLEENFDGVTGTTSSTINSHVLPNCWDYLNTSTTTSGTSTSGYPGYPIAYNGASYSHSGNNHMRFYTYTTTYYGDQYAILPQFGFDLDTVVVGFYARESSTTASYVGTIEVGVMTDPEDASTFEVVETVLPTTTSYEYFEVNFEGFAGTGRYIALRAPKPTTGYNIVYLDDLTVKLREKVNTLPNNGGTVTACNEYVMPDTANGGSYQGGLNATYVLRPAQAGYVARIQGDYDLEEGYDFLNVYRGAANANNLVGRYTGTGSIDYMTGSELWQDSGYVTLVLTTDVDNAFPKTGFKLLVSCEQPNANMIPIEDVVEANGTYTWALGNGQTFTNHSTMEAAPDMIEDITIPVINVAGFDSVYRHLTLTLHPTYELNYSYVMCERDEYEFYGNTYTTTGNYTVTLQSQYGADSTGILMLQVNPAPSVAIYQGGSAVEEITNYCDNTALTLQARSNNTAATFVWDNDNTATGATYVVYPHESNTYSVVATAPTGCTSLPATVTVTTTPVPAMTISGAPAICYGLSDTLTLADANNVDATYRWSTNATTTSIVVAPTTETTYRVVATSTTGACRDTAEFTVKVNALPVVAATAEPSEICQNGTITLNADEVDGYSYSWNTGAESREATVAATATGNFTVTVTDQNGCVNQFNTNNVIVNRVYDLNDTQSVCYTQNPYTWGQQTITADGNYEQTFQTVNGCDSTVHLTFTFEQMSVQNTRREVCKGTEVVWGPETITATESTTLSYVLNSGDTDPVTGTVLDCPAQYNLILTVNSNNGVEETETVCDSYEWNGQTYTTTGDYTVTFADANGCLGDSVLHLTVNYQNTGVDVLTACDSYEWIDGNTYSESNNTATQTLVNQWGCDSVVTLNLTVNYRSYHEEFHCVRDAQSFTWNPGNGRTYNLSVDVADSVQYVTGTNNDGCLEIALLHLVMNPVVDTLAWTTVEACDEYIIENQVVFNDGDDCEGHIETLYLHESDSIELRTRAADGHDQWTRINLIVTPSSYHTTVAEECLPYTWIIEDAAGEPFEVATITEAMVNGAAVFNMSVDMAEAGYVASSCASIEVLRLTPKYPTTVVDTIVTICQNGSWVAENSTVFNGDEYSTGTYTWDNTGVNEVGCRLTRQVDLTVNPVYYDSMTLTFCESDFTFSENQYVKTVNDPNHAGQTVELAYTTPLNGTPLTDQEQIANWQTETGCDSIVVITFTVNPETTDTTDATACHDYTWAANNTRYTESGTYTAITTNGYGCRQDNVLNLTITGSVLATIDTTVCYEFVWEGTTYYTDQSFEYNVAGTGEACDTNVTINFHVRQRALNHQYVVSNRPYTWQNGRTYEQSIEDVYFDIPVGEGQCDSVLALHFTMTDPIAFCDNQTYETGINGIVLSADDATADTASFCLDNPFATTVGGPSDLYWGTKFNASRTADWYTVSGANLYYVEGYSGTYTLNVFAGGDDAPATLIGTKTISFGDNEATGWKFFQLDAPVAVDGQSIWVTFEGHGLGYPVACVQYYDENDQNGAWVSTDGIYWESLNSNNNTLFYSFMIKTAYAANMYRNNDPQGNDTILYYSVNKTYNNTIADTACDSYTWDTTTYTVSGSYSKSYTSVLGCDSTVTMNLVINNSTTGDTEAVACVTFDWYEHTGITASCDNLTHVFAGANANGCDSTVTLHLTINPATSIIDTQVACDSLLWIDNVMYYASTTTPTMVLSDIHGCDSTVTLHLTINTNEGVNETVTACGSYTWNGNTYTANTVASIPFEDANGCWGDSVLVLTINNNVTGTYDSIVNAASTIYNGVLYMAPTDTVINDTIFGAAANGCDSITEVRLVVNLGGIVVDSIVYCGDYIWRDGNTYTWIPMAERLNPAFNYKNRATNQPVEDFPIYEVDINNDGLIDVTYVLHLTMAEASVEYKTVTVLLSHDTYTDPADATQHVFDFTAEKAAKQNATKLDTLHYGSTYYCDSIVYYTFNLVYNYDTIETTYLCYGDALAAGQTVGELFLVNDTVNRGTDNEMVHTHQYIRNRELVENVTLSACDSIEWNGAWRTGNATYTTTKVVNGITCDSVVNLTLNVTTTIHNVVLQDVCDNFYWADKDSTYEVSTTDTWSRPNATDEQCTDVDTLKLVVRNSTNGTDTQVACDSLVWIDGITYYASNNTATHTLTNAAGCDSVVTLNLTVNNSFVGPGNNIDTVAASITLTDNNGTYLFLAPYDGDTTLHYTTVNGCDSTVTFHITVNQFQIIADNPIECGVYTWTVEANPTEGILAHGNNHTYMWISDAEKSEHAINIPGTAPMLPLYKDLTTNSYVYSRPMDTVEAHVYLLNLNLNEAAFVDSTIARFPQSVETLTLNGVNYNLAGVTSATHTTYDTVITQHLSHETLCGTVKKYNVHVVYNYTTDDATVCFTDTYTWEDNTTSTVNVGSQTLTQTLYANDWDNLQVVTRTITVRANNNTVEQTQEVCDSIQWNGETYTTTGDYYYTTTDQYGCDSLTTLHLTVKYNTGHIDNVYACDSVQWNGNWYYASTTAGEVTYNYTATNGCPSVDTLLLTINHNTPVVTVVDTCDLYTWDVTGRDYLTSGDYTATRTDGNNCQAVDTLKLTIRQSTSYDSVLWVTDGSYRYSAQDGSTTLILAGEVRTFAEHYTNVAGCDSTLNLEIHVGDGYFAAEDVVSCNSYTWRDGNTYVWISPEESAANNNALYKNQTTNTYVLSNPIFYVPQIGTYDSIYMLRLNLTQNYTEDVNINFPISLGSLTYGDSTFTFITSSDEGREFVTTTVDREVHFASDYYCDSIHYLHVTLQNNYSEVVADAADICVTQTSYTWRGHEISTVTSDYDHAHIYYVYDTVGTAEAPVVEYIKVTQHPLSYSTERRTACDSYTWNGTEYTESTTNATFTTVDRFGCDSTVTLILNIKKSTDSVLTTTVCETFTWNGVEYTESADVVVDNLTNAVGCDSTATLHLTVNHVTSAATTVDVCDSYTWTEGDGGTYTMSDTVYYTYSDVAGVCTSVDTLYLTIRHNTNQTIDITACDSYIWSENGNGQTYNASGVYTYDYTATNGCPSTNTLNLTINNNSGHTDVVTVCDSYEWNGTTYTESTTTATYNYTDGNGCASTDTLNLTVKYSTHNSETVVACMSYEWHGSTFTNPSSVGDLYYGNYEYSYTNEVGCPSVDTLHLTLGGGRTFSTVTVNDWCGPYTWVVNGEEVATYDENGEYSTTFLNPRTGCDSVVFLTLTIKNAPVVDTADAVCENTLPYVWRGITMNAAGVETVAFPMDNGCDSTIRFTLTVYPKYDTLLTDRVCLGDSYKENGFDISAAELPEVGEFTFTNTLQSVMGCDSIVTLKIEVLNIFTTTVEATACDSYTWTNGNGMTYTESGNYDYSIPAENSCDSVITLALTINNSTTGVDVQTACNRYTWMDGETYTASNNTATYTLENAVGCDSVVTLNLTVNYSNNSEISDEACDSYSWNGATYTTTGIYTYAGTNVDGCDSVVTLHLTVNHSTTAAVEATACDSYEWTLNGQTYTESGVYTYTMNNAAGCDSVVTLTLTINESEYTTESAMACDSYVWHGHVYTESGVYNDTTETAAGCPSIATLNLTINNNIIVNEEATACDSYNWHGQTFTESGVYNDIVRKEDGCDSLFTLTLTLNIATIDTVEATACDSYEWALDGYTYTQSGEYSYTTTGTTGCDSVVILLLTINESEYTTEDVTACDSYEWNGHLYTESGVYNDTTETTAGCLSVATLNLTVNNSNSESVSATACDSYSWNGQTYVQSGVYTYTTTNMDGCDSTVTLTLTLNHSDNVTVMMTACDSYSWNGQTYYNSGVYNYTTTNVAGCDSNVTLVLTINNATASSMNVTACNSYNWNGQTYDNSGVYTYTTTNSNGCDSVVTLNLTVNYSTSASQTVATCGSYVWNGQTYTASGNYSYTTTGSNGCDSTTVLSLTINPAVSTSFSESVCGSYTWNGVTYNQSGAYVQTFSTVENCDSVVTLLLTIQTPVTSTVTATACGSYLWDGMTYTTSGTYTRTYTAVNGCDSIVTLNLTVNNATTATETAEACESYQWHGQTYTTSGTYTYTTTNVNGCDSVITLTLTINHATAGVDEQTACDSYTWMNGMTYTTSTNTPTFTITNANGCDSVVTLHLTLGHSTLDTIYVTAEGSYTWHGVNYSMSGFYPYTGTTVEGCDSIVILGLTVTPPTHVLTLMAKDTAGTVGIGGTVNGGGTYAEGDTATLTATPDEGYAFYGWEIDGVIVSTMTPYRYAMGTSDVTITGVFIDQTFYSVSLMAGTVSGEMNVGGTVDGAGLYLAGTRVTITAVPDEGYVFDGWYTTTAENPNGELVTNYPVYSFEVNGDCVFVAVFASEVDSNVILTVSYDANMGRVLINGEEREGDFYQGTLGETVTLEAIAKAGYTFAAWSDGDTNASRTLVLDQNVMTIRAIFFRTTGIDDVDGDDVVILTQDTRIIVRGAEQMPVYVYDVVGRLIDRVDHAASEQVFELNETGIYLVKVGTMAARRVVVRR